jgi:cytochrome c oxidase subunit II
MRSRLFACLIVAAFIITFTGACLMAAENEQTIKITAKKFEYSPKEIVVKKGVPIVLEFTSLDRMHGFDCPDLKIRTDIPPGKTSTLRFVPDRVGIFPFHCDNFCGTGHEGMRGTIKVIE